MSRYSSILLSFFCIFQLSLSAQQNLLSNDEIFGSSKLVAKKAKNFRAMNDGEHYTNISSGKNGTYVIKYSLKSDIAVDTIIKDAELVFENTKLEINDYAFSNDESKILLMANEERVYRHSTKADNYVFDLKTRNLQKISLNGKLMYGTFSPDAKNIAYVRDNNLYVMSLSDYKEIAVTTDGKRNKIINGATDWVYEEEFDMTIGYRWSPDGTKIAYYKFDESKVKEMELTYYGDLYPSQSPYKYPKAGEENSKVEVYIYNVKNSKSLLMDTGKEREYLPRIVWTRNSDLLSIQTLNRHQNELEILLCDVNSGKSKSLLKEKNNSFIEITNDLYFLTNGTQFIWTSSSDGFNHIYLYDLNGKLVKQISKGKFEVTLFYGYDELSKLFYYQSTQQGGSNRHLYSCNIQGKETLMTPQPGIHVISFCKGFKYFNDTYSSYGKPFISTLNDQKGKVIRTLETNEKLVNELKKYTLSDVETLTVKTEGEIDLLGWMIKPKNFDASKKYPVILYMYGGPGRQTVLNEWGGNYYLWHQMMAQKGYIIISVDNRGTPGRGIDFVNCIYKDMGNIELKDQLTVIDYLKTQNYVDGSRIGAWGWSFGGYLTSLLMTKGNEVVKAAVAMAPVTNWRYYDNIYTERYLQTPQENPKGYEDNSPINFANDLKGKFLLAHGVADDNVHFQNSIDFITALVKANKQFDLMIYPNEAHSLLGKGMRLNFFSKMTDFFDKNL